MPGNTAKTPEYFKHFVIILSISRLYIAALIFLHLFFLLIITFLKSLLCNICALTDSISVSLPPPMHMY